MLPPDGAGPLAGRLPDQIGLLVRDLDRSLDSWSRVFGLGPWRIYRYAPDTVPSLWFEGKSGAFSLRLALSATQPQLELIEPLKGPSIYDEWVEQHGEGLHHLGFWVDSIAALSPAMEAAGYPLIQAGGGYGLDGDGGFAYFDTVADLGIVSELIEVPARRRPPDEER